jgi:flagellin-like protein
MSIGELFNDRERGQVGIETLIIFIAMILVAAVAAGVLINTAGFLQNKAKSTSADSTEQVSNQVIVVTSIGQVNSNGQNITDLNFTVMESPGANEIDLQDATIEFIGPNGHDTLTYNSSAQVGNFTVEGVKDPDNSAPVLNDRDDRFGVNIALNTTAGADGPLERLHEGEEATVRFVTQSGSTYTYVVNVPESLSSSAGSSVEL